jgi:hypothetical protein
MKESLPTPPPSLLWEALPVHRAGPHFYCRGAAPGPRGSRCSRARRRLCLAGPGQPARADRPGPHPRWCYPPAQCAATPGSGRASQAHSSALSLRRFSLTLSLSRSLFLSLSLSLARAPRQATRLALAHIRLPAGAGAGLGLPAPADLELWERIDLAAAPAAAPTRWIWYEQNRSSFQPCINQHRQCRIEGRHQNLLSGNMYRSIHSSQRCQSV